MLKKTINLYFSGLIFFVLLFSMAGVTLCHGDSSGTGYKIGSRDVLVIVIIASGEEQVNVELVVNDKGNINVPFLGKTYARGISLTSLESKIRKPLAADYFVDPQIHIQVKEYHSLQFFISGAVKRPGLYELDFHPTIMDIIAKAEGVLPERGNIAYILHGAKGSVDAISDKLSPKAVKILDKSGKISAKNGKMSKKSSNGPALVNLFDDIFFKTERFQPEKAHPLPGSGLNFCFDLYTCLHTCGGTCHDRYRKRSCSKYSRKNNSLEGHTKPDNGKTFNRNRAWYLCRKFSPVSAPGVEQPLYHGP
ncbi:MAG: polysaccharide biosynthesis/export family protein [Thermodesulfobacteriota bacterium]|nr:polysaccharide biosynthesis/export family protein [Thermodesulfobacteriota bacterium]